MASPFPTVPLNATQFQHPFTMTVSGSTGSGKSEWVMKLLNHLGTLITAPIQEVLYCYGELNPNIIKLQTTGTVGGGIRVVVHSGTPSEQELKERARSTDGRLLVILDDLMVGMRQQFLDTVFTRGSHNWGMSVVLVTQHLFTKELKVARNNSHYLVLMRNPAGALQIKTLATQLFPTKTADFMQAYKDATSKQFGYLLVDMHPKTPELIRLRTHIYSDDGQPTTVYMS